MSKRPITTLFMLMSVDGKISTGSTDNLDFDTDLPKINELKEGLEQYYDIEKTTDIWSLNSGRVQAKIGVNDREYPDDSGEVNYVILDNTHLTRHGVEYFVHKSNKFILVTSNKNHPAFSVKANNFNILLYEELNFEKMLEDLYEKFGCEKITIQTGGTLNAEFLRNKLFDYVDIVVAPALIGGKETSTLIDGKSFTSKTELSKIGILELEKINILKNSYIRLKYKVKK